MGMGTIRMLVSLSLAIGIVLDRVMEWTSEGIKAAVSASAEALGYGQLTSNQSKFRLRHACDCRYMYQAFLVFSCQQCKTGSGLMTSLHVFVFNPKL